MRFGRSLAIGLVALAVSAEAQQNHFPKIGEAPALPANVRPPQLMDVGIDEHLGSSVDLNLTFIAEN